MQRICCCVIICISLVLSGCVSSGTARKKKVSVEPSVQKIPSAVDESTSSTDVRYTFLDTINRGNELILTDNDFDKSGRQENGDVAAATPVAATSYRVQVLATNRIETIREQKKDLEKKITEQVVIGFEAPYYKLYAGNFLKRQDAQATLLKIKKLGFLDAWIVSTSVIPEN